MDNKLIATSAQETLSLNEALDRLIAAVLRLASIDYIKAKRKYNRKLLTKEKLEKERAIYAKCIENWTPFTYDVINPEYMIRECDKIAELKSFNVDRMGNFKPGKKEETNDKSRGAGDNLEMGL